ncbi:MAG: acyl carrier protein [Chloroflexaceae bacterium]|nr:acyl carrier protein [Chloroflexaceae bacterium]
MIETIIDQLRHIIAEQLDVNIRLEDIEADTPLFEGGLGLDSIAIMAFITLIEENFHFQFAEDELTMEPFQNLRTLAHFVSTKMEVPQN